MKVFLKGLLICILSSNIAFAKLAKSYPGFEKKPFEGLGNDTRMKIALFLDDSPKSLKAIEAAQKIKAHVDKKKDNIKYNYVWVWVDCRNNACAPAFTSNFPYIFTFFRFTIGIFWSI